MWNPDWTFWYLKWFILPKKSCHKFTILQHVGQFQVHGIDLFQEFFAFTLTQNMKNIHVFLWKFDHFQWTLSDWYNLPKKSLKFTYSSTFGEFQVHGIDLFQDFFGLVHANSSLLCERSQSVPLITNSLAPRKWK